MNPGVQVSDAEARNIFNQAGCQVDEKTNIVKIPEYIVNRALLDCPSQDSLYMDVTQRKRSFHEHKGKVHWTCFGTGARCAITKAPGTYETCRFH